LNGGKELPFRRIGFDGFVGQKAFLSFQFFGESLKLLGPAFQFTDKFLSDGFLALNGFQESPLRPPRLVNLLLLSLHFRDTSLPLDLILSQLVVIFFFQGDLISKGAYQTGVGINDDS
jgi:hypothetical protein